MIPYLIILLLVAICAFYVAAEFAAVGVRTSRVQQEAEDGSTLARRLLPHLQNAASLDRYIAACQIGITITSLIVGAYGQAALASRLTPVFENFGALEGAAAQSTAAVVVLIGLTIFTMVLGELVPKSVALQAPTRVALLTVIPMEWSLRVMAWFIDWLNGAGTAILRLLRMPQSGHRHVHSAEEIAFLVAESGKVGLLKPNEQVRLRHALQLSDRPARDLMVPRVAIVAHDATQTVASVLGSAIEDPYTRFPVFDGSIDHIIGVVHVRDIARVPAREAAERRLSDIMRPVVVAPASMRVDRLLVRLKEERRTIAILLDEYGGTAGLITIDDILDDLIGDIADEFRAPRQQVERLPDGRLRLAGSLTVETASRWARVQFTSEAATLSGAIAASLERVPKAGDRLTLDGVDIEVEAVDHFAVVSVLVTPRGKAHA